MGLAGPYDVHVSNRVIPDLWIALPTLCTSHAHFAGATNCLDYQIDLAEWRISGESTGSPMAFDPRALRAVSICAAQRIPNAINLRFQELTFLFFLDPLAPTGK